MTKDALEKVALPGIMLTYLGQSGRPVGLGTHEGNQFIITVRNLDAQPTITARFINLFGGQRFSTHNVPLGRAVVKRQWDVVIDHLSHDPARASVIRQALAKHPKDTLGALRHVPTMLLTLFVHAYQSGLWNVLAQALADAGTSQQDVPILGFGTTNDDIAKFPLISEQLKAEAITPRDFVIRQLPDLSAEGGSRPLYAEAEGLKASGLEQDERNAGKKKMFVEFTLRKGSYATEFIRQTFGNA
ncbi:MAG: tRNA pseudouridine(13) synthase TruD [Nanoarchaeota archaeon]